MSNLYIGTSRPSKAYVGTNEVSAIYLGATKVWHNTPSTISISISSDETMLEQCTFELNGIEIEYPTTLSAVSGSTLYMSIHPSYGRYRRIYLNGTQVAESEYTLSLYSSMTSVNIDVVEEMAIKWKYIIYIETT